MKHLILIIGGEIIINQHFMDYIYRSYTEHFDELGEVLTLSKDKDFPFIIERLSKHYDFLSIFASFKSYATTAKILATLSDDNLILENDLLVPSKASFKENSFLIELNKAKVNVLRVDTATKLPALLCTPPFNFIYFCLLGMDKDSVNVLIASLASSHEVGIVSTQLLDDLVLLKATASSFSQLESFMGAVFKLFAGKIFLGAKPLDFIVSKLLENKLQISFAESCTGGLCAAKLTSYDGVSEIFKGSMVTYSNELKHKWLGVSEDILENGGVYSERCVYFMLKGLFKTAKTDFAIALSGVAGSLPDEGCTPGVVYIGCMYKDGSFIQERLELCGDRELIREQAVLACFTLLLKLKPQLFLT